MHRSLSESRVEMIDKPPEGFSYISDFLDSEEQQKLLQHLDKLEYVHDVFRGQRLKRKYAQFGYAYVSMGHQLSRAAPLPEFLQELIVKGMLHCPQGSGFNQCIVTHYPEGAGIGWHTDAPRFGECIMAVSLGAEARLQFRENGAKDSGCELLARPGSLYVMCGPARWEYQHQVVPVESVRYSLTFRFVPKEPENR